MSPSDRWEDSFKALIENNPFGAYLVDADLRLRLISRGARKAFAGIDPLLGRDIGEILHILWPDAFAREVMGRFRKALQTGESYEAPVTIEQRLNIDSIEAYDWRVDRIPMPDGRHGLICHFYDLSERHQLQINLAESEEALQTIIDNVPAGILVMDQEANIISINPGAAAMIESIQVEDLQDYAEHFETHYRDGGSMPESDWPVTRAMRGEFVTDMEMVIRRKPDGSPRTISCTTLPLPSTRNNHILVVTHDLSRYYRDQRVLRESQDRLRLLANPILSVASGVLLLPLIGAIDERRSRDLEMAVLAQIQKHRARVLVVDVTGTVDIDRSAAEGLIRTIKAARLQGASTILTGISLELAEQLVALNIALDMVHTTTGSLESGLQIADQLRQEPAPHSARAIPSRLPSGLRREGAGPSASWPHR